MSGIKIYVKNEEEKARLIEAYLSEDNHYLAALDKLKADLKAQGVDIESPEGKKVFIRAVRELNARINP